MAIQLWCITLSVLRLTQLVQLVDLALQLCDAQNLQQPDDAESQQDDDRTQGDYFVIPGERAPRRVQLIPPAEHHQYHAGDRRQDVPEPRGLHGVALPEKLLAMKLDQSGPREVGYAPHRHALAHLPEDAEDADDAERAACLHHRARKRPDVKAEYGDDEDRDAVFDRKPPSGALLESLRRAVDVFERHRFLRLLVAPERFDVSHRALP